MSQRDPGTTPPDGDAAGDLDADLDAGGFSSWLDGMERALQGAADSDVPCGTCTACCTASQFVHIAPDENDTLAHIPDRLLFRAPLLPPGHVLMGYDDQGRCPMLVDDRCSIYDHRPRTCRTYDCRVFPAAGVAPGGEDDPDKDGIARRARRWRFEHPTELDRARHDAVIAAADFVAAHRSELPETDAPANATQLAVLALRVHATFLGPDPESDVPKVITPDVAEVAVVLNAGRPAD